MENWSVQSASVWFYSDKATSCILQFEKESWLGGGSFLIKFKECHWDMPWLVDRWSWNPGPWAWSSMGSKYTDRFRGRWAHSINHRTQSACLPEIVKGYHLIGGLTTSSRIQLHRLSNPILVKPSTTWVQPMHIRHLPLLNSAACLAGATNIVVTTDLWSDCDFFKWSTKDRQNEQKTPTYQRSKPGSKRSIFHSTCYPVLREAARTIEMDSVPLKSLPM